MNSPLLWTPLLVPLGVNCDRGGSGSFSSLPGWPEGPSHPTPWQKGADAVRLASPFGRNRQGGSQNPSLTYVKEEEPGRKQKTVTKAAN
jgi:hypothetical protein